MQDSAPALDVGVLLIFHPEVELSWLAEGYGDGLLGGEYECEVLLHQINMGITHPTDAVRWGNEGFKEIAVSREHAWLARWSERYAQSARQVALAPGTATDAICTRQHI